MPVAAIDRSGCSVDAAGCFGDRAPSDHVHGGAQRWRVHVVEQHRIDAEHQRLAQLRKRIDFEFDLDEMPDRRARALDRRPDPAGDRNVVVLDEHRIVEAEAVIAAASHAHRVFLQSPQARQRLARAGDARLVLPDGIGDARGRTRDAAQMPRKFSAVRSAVSRPRAEPRTTAIVSPGPTRLPSGRCTAKLDGRVD